MCCRASFVFLSTEFIYKQRINVEKLHKIVSVIESSAQSVWMTISNKNRKKKKYAELQEWCFISPRKTATVESNLIGMNSKKLK